MTAWMVGVDTGGTFTDLIAIERTSGDIRRAKVPSNPDDPSRAVLNALTKLFASGVAPADVSIFVHGTTVATNALLEGTGVRAGLLITRGFRATYEARGASQPSGQDLLDTLILYCKSGLESEEYCLWIVAEPLTIEEAKDALKGAVPDLDTYLAGSRLEIASARDWFSSRRAA